MSSSLHLHSNQQRLTAQTECVPEPRSHLRSHQGFLDQWQSRQRRTAGLQAALFVRLDALRRTHRGLEQRPERGHRPQGSPDVQNSSLGILLGLIPCRKSSVFSSTAVCPVRPREGRSHRACRLLRGPVGYFAQEVFVLRVPSHVATVTALGIDDNSRTATESWSSIRSRWADGDLKQVETGPRNPPKEESPSQSVVFGKIEGPEFLCSQRGGLQGDHCAPPPVCMNSQ
jgi:hypothetical protein